VVVAGARRVGIVAVVLASEGAIGAFHQLMTSALRTASTAARPATAWRHGTRRAPPGLSDSAVSG
jgi:hypothetical protein